MYLARVAWLSAGVLVAQLENRDQTQLDLFAFHPTSGVRTLLLTETDATWINLNDIFTVVPNTCVLGVVVGWFWGKAGLAHTHKHTRLPSPSHAHPSQLPLCTHGHTATRTL